MKKVLKFVKNFIIIVFLIAYFSVVIGVSTLLIARNDFNFTQFGDKVIAIIDKNSATEKYKENSIVLLKNVKIESLKQGQEVFIYDVDQVTSEVSFIIEKVGKTVYEGTTSPHVVLDNLGTNYGQDYIAGIPYKTIDNYGKYLNILQGKWVFFGLLIVPCFFILIYEIYLLIIAIKYDDGSASISSNNTNAQQAQPTITLQPQQSNNTNIHNDQVANTSPAQQINTQVQSQQVQQQPQSQSQISAMDIPLDNLNDISKNNTVNSTNVANGVSKPNDNNTEFDNQKKIEELMNEVQKLKEEYSSK